MENRFINNKIALIYHNDYNKYDLGTSHPLISDKPRKSLEFFKEKNIFDYLKIFQAKKAKEEDILKVHNPRYVERVKQLSKTGGMLSLDTPAPKGIYDIALLVTGGTKLAGEKLFKGFNCAINPLAGFHHASESSSSGFCFFNDIAIVIENLRERYNLERFQIIDLDVHHANGTQEIYYDDPSVLNISFHQDGRTLYPGTGSIEKIGRDSGEGFTVNLPFPPGTGSGDYILAFDTIIPYLTEEFNPQILIYQCGVDTHHSDPLANLCLTYQTYYYLANRIMSLSKKTCNKLLVLFGGGYNSRSSVISYFNIMCGLLDKKEYLSEEMKQDIFASDINPLLEDFKSIYSPFWDF